MKTKIVALKKNEDFKSLLKGKKISNKYFTIFFNKLLNKDNKNLNVSFVTKKKLGNAVKRNKIKRRLKNITNDKIVKKASKYYPGLRVTRQDPFQCCISFIVSANSNIPNIRMRLQKLCIKFGTKVMFQKREFFLFPTPKMLANATLQDLQECKLGYRSKYVLDTSRLIASREIDFDELKKAEYGKCKELLLKLPGIGDKVADCVMLFSLEKLGAFPLDTWIVKILQKYYSENFRMDKKTISKREYENIH